MYELEYLHNLIANHEQENIHLEYKAAAALARVENKMTEISKDVSAFANADGGILVYGISERKDQRNLPDKIDPIDRTVISREWLEQIINNRIRPRIQGIVIHPVEIPGDADQVVYIVEIPKGETAHQSDDKRYYRRYNFMVEAMYDHEVRDVMNRLKTPQIELAFEIKRKKIEVRPVQDGEPQMDAPLVQAFSYTLHVSTENTGRMYANFINVDFDFPENCIHPQPYDRMNSKRRTFSGHNKVRDRVQRGSDHHSPRGNNGPQYGPARYEPLLPGMKRQLLELRINEYAIDAGNVFRWKIFADNAEARSGETAFSTISINPA